MIGEPERDCGLAVRYEGSCASLTISPGEGTLGSLSCKFMRTVERRLPACEDCRLRAAELPEEPMRVQYPFKYMQEGMLTSRVFLLKAGINGCSSLKGG